MASPKDELAQSLREVLGVAMPHHIPGLTPVERDSNVEVAAVGLANDIDMLISFHVKEHCGNHH